jgi:hypothetical protein
MKRKIKFLITVNSYYPKRHSGYQLIFPMGGEQEYHEFEFETDDDKPSREDFDIAYKELRKIMGIVSYHIWYWWWIK